MNLSFSKLIPSPFLDTDYSVSQVWGRDFTLQGSTSVLVSAASGKGKTTLVNIIIGQRKDYVGTMLIDGKSPLDMNARELSILLSRKISTVHQGLMLFDELDTWQNIALKNRITNFKTDSEIDEMLNQLGLAAFKKQKIKRLSYGQKQRVAIIRALCQPFGFILLDEPFSHLDSENASKAWDLIVSEAKLQQAGIVMTSLGGDHKISFDQILQL